VLKATRTKIVDPASRKEILERGIPGELLYAGPGVFPGYWKRPDLTAKVLDEEDLFKERGVAIYKYPERLEMVDALPRNALNKVEKKKLRQMVASHLLEM